MILAILGAGAIILAIYRFRDIMLAIYRVWDIILPTSDVLGNGESPPITLAAELTRLAATMALRPEPKT